MKRRGTVVVELILIVALLGGGAWFTRDLWGGKDKERAKDSQQSTERLVEAQDAKGASVAASVTMIGRANNEAPESPTKEFIAKEVPVALAQLPEPDPQTLLEAEKRKNAVMEGKLHEVARLYGEAFDKARSLQAERDAAVADRRAMDQQLIDAAEARANAELKSFIWRVVAVLLLGLAAYFFLMRVGPSTLGKMISEVRAGKSAPAAVQAFNTYIPNHLHDKVRHHAKLATEPSDEDAA